MTQLSQGIALQAARRHTEALARFESIAVDAPERAAARLHAAFSWLAVGDAVAARRAAEEAAARLPPSSAAQFALGQADLALGRPEAAEAAFRRALQMNSTSSDLWTVLATARRQAGDPSAAERALRRALRLDPDHAGARAALAAFDARRPMMLKAWRPAEASVGLALAVDYLAAKTTFAKLGFGEWSRTLSHQARRGHQVFAVDDKPTVQGLLGWAFTSEPLARAWLEDRRGLADEECRDGDCVIVNAWAADSCAASRVLMQAARREFAGRKTLYFKRFYLDGRVRPMRLSINAFVAGHSTGPDGVAACNANM